MARKVPLDAVSDWIGSACRRTEWTPGGRTERAALYGNEMRVHNPRVYCN